MEDVKTLIADDVEITGSLKCSGGVKLAGKINGDLTCGGEVLVEKSAAIKGNVTAASLVVLGMIKGNVVAKERIELRGTARVAGDIRGRRLVVEEGVTLIGKSEITPSEGAGGDVAPEVETASARPDEGSRMDDDPAKAVSGMRPVMENRPRPSQLFARK